MDLIGYLRRIQNAGAAETFDQATDSLEAIRDFLAGGGAGSPGLCYYGVVSAIPGANQFTLPELAGLGAGKFADVTAPYRAFVLRDAGGASAVPQGEMQTVTAYDTATGSFTTPAFTAAVAVGDEILILHPRLAEIVDILADIGDASAATLGSLYGILGNPATALSDALEHVLKHTRTTYYVDGISGNDANTGLDPDQAFATIGAAIAAAGDGDIIKVSEDTYDEAGLDITQAGASLICEPGTYIIDTTPGTVLTVSGDNCFVKNPVLMQAGAVGLHVTGAVFRGEDILASLCTTGFDIDGPTPTLIRCRSSAHTVEGFNIAEDTGYYEKCVAIGTAATWGFNISHANADGNVFNDCHSTGNTAGSWNVIVGADDNVFVRCTQGVNDGARADAGNNIWIQFGIGSLIAADNALEEDLGDIYDRIGAPAGASIAADLVTIAAYLDTEIAAILADTDDMQPKLGTPAADLAADIAAIKAVVDAVPTEGYFEQTVPVKMNCTQTINATNGDKDFIASGATGASGLISTDDAKVQKVMLLIIGRAVNIYAGANALDCTTATWNQWQMNLDGGAYGDLTNEEADGQMLDNDWRCPVEGAIHPFTLMFDIDTELTNIDGKIGVRLATAQAEQISLIVTIDVYLKILWKL